MAAGRGPRLGAILTYATLRSHTGPHETRPPRMTTRYFGAPIKRNEDARLLPGRALFVDDLDFPDLLHACFLRSTVAHARIRRIDPSAALRRPGVVAVYMAADLGDYWQPGPLLVPPPPIPGITFNQRTQ